MKKLWLLACSFSFSFLLQAQPEPAVPANIRTSKKIMNDFMDKRFGMFIHWGPVTLRGTEIGWSRGSLVARNDYDSLYREFDPVLFNADTWVKTAKNAGMKYLTIIAKHHDGFCMWPTAYTDYSIGHTPFKKDVVGELARACKEQGIKFCIYYSVLDWHCPYYPMHSPDDKEPDPKADMDKYIVYMKHQLKELITRYHPYMLWFDGNWETPWTKSRAVDMYEYIKSLDPSVIVNNRLGKGKSNEWTTETVGDYKTPEQEIGSIDMQTPWESCITIGTQWSWKPNDKLKSLKECIRTLASTAGGNGNLLLNVSPMPDGRMEARQIRLLKEMGDWLKVYGEAIYNTKGGPYRPDSVYAATRKGNTIYLLLLEKSNGLFSVPAVPGLKVLNARFMNGPSVSFKEDEENISLNLPDKLPNGDCNVIELKMSGNVESVPVIDK